MAAITHRVLFEEIVNKLGRWDISNIIQVVAVCIDNFAVEEENNNYYDKRQN